MSAAGTSAAPPSAVHMTAAGMRDGARRMFPVSAFVIPFGLAFGAAAIDQGLSPLDAMLMSAFVFAGASQFAALEVLRQPLPYMSVALIVLAVNARHIIMGAALSPWVNALPRHQRFWAMLVLSDANFVDAQPAFRSGYNDVGRLVGSGIALWIAWLIGTAVGAVIGDTVGSMRSWGIDVVMVCFFTAIITGELKRTTALLPAAVACLVAALTIDVLPAGWNVIVAALVGGVTGALYRGR